MAKVYSILEGGMIEVGARRGAKIAPNGDDGALAAAVKYNQYLVDSLKAAEAKAAAAVAAQVKAEARAAEAEAECAEYEAAEKNDDGEEARALAAINTAISGLQSALGKLVADVKAIRDKPAPAAPKPEPAKPVVVPAPVVDMTAIINTIRAEIARAAPKNVGKLETVVVERDANGYIKQFVTKSDS